MPRLSVADGKIYTFTRHALLGSGTAGLSDRFSFAVVDPDSGRLDNEQFVGATTVDDTLQMVGAIAPGPPGLAREAPVNRRPHFPFRFR